MGKRENTLHDLLTSAVPNFIEKPVSVPNYNDIWNSSYREDVQTIYLNLGGILPKFPLRLRKWDIILNGIAVELDEQLHFNRYRHLTLQSSIYKQLKTFPLNDYQHYCLTYEDQCLKAGSYGKRWSNKSCEDQFGQASPLGCLSDNGSPRWKQRAFYDYVKDVSQLVLGISVVRLAVWDRLDVEGVELSIAEILDQNMLAGAEALYKLILKRSEQEIF